ncbi:SIMPL domain-containing protein [Selenomonas massiliensis]|uniref:SIMPL domain-containing protein n=1 Tax=Selenomonas massiliensis TaxID=2058293 RepID=UPI000D0ED852|nr:SIMPL domain-containing protein [Selenomonas massiliensis]
MKRFSFGTLVCAALLALTLVIPTRTASAEEALPTLTMNGVGSAQIAPDMAEITLGVITEAKDAAKAHGDNAAQAARVQAAVKALGVAERDIQTTRYDFSPIYDVKDNGRSVTTGYTVTNAIVVKVRNLANVGKVIDAALANGANRVDSLEFSASDPSAAKDAALADAARDARSKADAVARALGVRIVRILNVYADAQSPAPRNFMPMMMAKEAYDAGTPISAGELSFEASVNISYVIE